MNDLVRLKDMPDNGVTNVPDCLRPYLYVPHWAFHLWHTLHFDGDNTKGLGATTVNTALEFCSLSANPALQASAICAVHRLGGSVKEYLFERGSIRDPRQVGRIEAMGIKLLPFVLAGVTYRPADAQDAASRLGVGAELRLEREPTNQFDKYAVKVLAVGGKGGLLHIGYIPKTLNVCIANLMDAGLERFGLSLHTHVTKVEERASLMVCALVELEVGTS